MEESKKFLTESDLNSSFLPEILKFRTVQNCSSESLRTIHCKFFSEKSYENRENFGNARRFAQQTVD